MDSYKVFRSIVDKFIIAHAKLVGHNPFGFELNFATYFSVSLWYSVFFASFYTAFTDENPADGILCVFVGLFSTQGIVKSYVNLTKKKATQSALDFLDDLYKANKCNIENRRILTECVRWNMLFSKIFAAVAGLTAATCIVVPMGKFFITGQMDPILPMRIPFIPREELWGYAIHSAYSSAISITAYAGTVANEQILIISTMHIWPLYKIFNQSVFGLNEATGSFRKEAIKNSTWLHRRVRNIVLMHTELYFYVQQLSVRNYPIFTTEVYTDQWSLIILIYVLVVLKWPPAVLLLLFMLLKLFVFCCVGTAVEIMNDRILDALNNIDFVMLPLYEQKLILYMIQKAQNPPSFTAGVAPLNMVTFMDVVKTTYSFTMVLLKFA